MSKEKYEKQRLMEKIIKLNAIAAIKQYELDTGETVTGVVIKTQRIGNIMHDASVEIYKKEVEILRADMPFPRWIFNLDNPEKTNLINGYPDNTEEDIYEVDFGGLDSEEYKQALYSFGTVSRFEKDVNEYIRESPNNMNIEIHHPLTISITVEEDFYYEYVVWKLFLEELIQLWEFRSSTKLIHNELNDNAADELLESMKHAREKMNSYLNKVKEKEK